ncbi:anterior gradient protein 2 homolog isoform X3 [Hippocampus comes]|uniref:anterior gradient protein 2 homolog isoform X3 n=1 Tax=Hippocampus comes TaxID=109280 RepID=UPI00094E2500|nr:PREDICTED: anterior gradient protein 2 homolog isoform X3 [Hippocampus comes]
MFVCFQLKWPLPCCPCRFCLGLKSSFSNVYLAKMIKISPSLLLVLVAAAALTLGKYMPKTGKRIPQTLSRGWGDQLIWAQTYEQALYWARSRNKPLMVLFHLEDCPHSQALKKVFAEDDELQKVLDEDFVLLNLMVGLVF